MSEIKPILRCIWCCKDTKTSPCEHCGSDNVVDRTKPHEPHWSRATISQVECKICDRRGPYEIQSERGLCQPIK